MLKRRQRDLHNSVVKTLNNDYVRSNEEARQKKKQKLILRRRRMFLWFVLAFIIIAGLVDYQMTQKERLAEKQQQLEIAQKKKEDVIEKQEILKLQITRLKDDEYVAKLARKEYFLSDEGEIIFTMPSDSGKE